MQLGDFLPGSRVSFRFPTVNLTNGAAIAPVGLTLGMRKNAATTVGTTGLTLTVNEGGTTGLHYCEINTAADATFFSFGDRITVFATAGTVNGNPVAGLPLREFTLGQDSVILDAGVPQSVGLNLTRIRAAAAFSNGALAGKLLRVRGSTQNYFVSVPITNNVGDDLTHATLPELPTGTLDYEIRDGGQGLTLTAADIRAALGFASPNADTQFASVLAAANAAGTAATAASTAATAARDRLPATLQAGRVRAHIESINGVGAIGAGGTGNQSIGAV